MELVVTDEDGLSSTPDEVQISSDNLAPTADAGEDRMVVINEQAVLDGSGSSDPEDENLTYLWTITSAPSGSLAILMNSNSVTPKLTPDLEGEYIIKLVVSDLIGPGVPDTVNIMAVTAESFAESEIKMAFDFVAELQSGQVTTNGNQKALLNFLKQATALIQSGSLANAVSKLEEAITRTDGCAERGSPDGNGPGRDWVIDCLAQNYVYEKLTNALDALN